jgi:hypothetical protein
LAAELSYIIQNFGKPITLHATCLTLVSYLAYYLTLMMEVTRTHTQKSHPPCKLVEATAVQWVLLEIMKLPIYYDKSLQIQKLKKMQNTQINSRLFTINESSMEKRFGLQMHRKLGSTVCKTSYV